MSEASPYWFPAKRHGWGWGVPSAWQGRLALAVFFGLVLAGAWWLLPAHGQVAFLFYATLLCAVLVAVCWIKGEPPRWRRGKKQGP